MQRDGSSCEDHDGAASAAELAGCRPSWMFGAVSAFQNAVCQILGAEDPRDALVAALNGIPPARTRLEELLICGLVLESAIHAAGPAATTPDPAARRGVDLLFERRRGRSSAADIAATRAAQLIADDPAQSCVLRTLTRAVACNETTLRRAFRERFGMSIREYHARARVCAAVRQFAAGTHDVLAVARCVGYRSEKNFYRAVSKFTGLTPGELRDAKRPCVPARCDRLLGRADGASTSWCAVHRLRPRKPTGA